jgi:hypothetical protein
LGGSKSGKKSTAKPTSAGKKVPAKPAAAAKGKGKSAGQG